MKAKINLTQIDKQIAGLSKSSTALKRRLDVLYRRYDHTLGDVRPLVVEIKTLESRAKRIASMAQRFNYRRGK